MRKIAFLFRKIWENRSMFRSLLYSLYFNFHYLPFKQACRLPILLYKPKLLKLKGQIIIGSSNIHFGMVRLGFNLVSLYPNTGIVWENYGGLVCFENECAIGNASAISIGANANVYFGNSFLASTSLKLTSYDRIHFGNNVLIGWDNVFMDTDFHKLSIVGGGYKKSHAPIIIGNDNWFGLRCVIFKGTQTPDYCIVGGNSVLNKKYDISYSIIAGSPAELKGKGVYRNINDDMINYKL